MEAVIAVLGAGGHGHDIADSLQPKVVAFYDDHLPIGGVVCGDLSDFKGGEFIIGVNNCHTRHAIAEQLNRRGIRDYGIWVHPSTIVGPDVELGQHTHVNAGCTVTRATIGEFCTISPGVDICGDVTIGDLVTVGAGATICNFVTIETGATIGAGATVLPHTTIREGETWVGTPARAVVR